MNDSDVGLKSIIYIPVGMTYETREDTNLGIWIALI